MIMSVKEINDCALGFNRTFIIVSKGDYVVNLLSAFPRRMYDLIGLDHNNTDQFFRLFLYYFLNFHLTS